MSRFVRSRWADFRTWWFRAAGFVFNAGTFLGDPSIAAPVLQAIMNVSVQPERSGPYGSAVHTVCVSLALMGRFDAARSFLERAEAISEDSSDIDPAFAVRIEIARSWVELAEGHIARAMVGFSRARTLAHRTGDTWSRVAAPTFCAVAFSQIGDVERAQSAADEVAMFSQARFWIDHSALAAASARTNTQGAQGAREAITLLRPLLDKLDLLLAANARNAIAFALAAVGDFDDAEREAASHLERAFWPHAQAGALGALALVSLHRGQLTEAVTLAERGLNTSAMGMRVLSAESMLHLVRAEALHALGRTQDAHAAIREARNRIMDIATTLADAELGVSYVTNAWLASATTESTTRTRNRPEPPRYPALMLVAFPRFCVSVSTVAAELPATRPPMVILAVELSAVAADDDDDENADASTDGGGQRARSCSW